MTDQAIEDDIAFIRRTIESGRAYARGTSPDMLVWGLAVATGYVANYAAARHWLPFAAGWVWLLAIPLPWAYSLRRVAARLLGSTQPRRSPLAQAMGMVWLGTGLFLLAEAFGAQWAGAHYASYDAVVAGAMGLAFFASASLCNLGWMRAVALAWWLGVFVLYRMRDMAAAELLCAAMMLLLLAGPGLALYLGARKA